MQLEIDFRSGNPIYLQILDQIKSLILSGKLQPDEQLPTVRQLASDLRVNFNTVARAYRLLDEAGLISTQHGRGTYVLPPPEESGEVLRRRALQGLIQQFLAQAGRLGYSTGEILAGLHEQIDEMKDDPLRSEEAERPKPKF
jgi:GntR family transcriptional regulator